MINCETPDSSINILANIYKVNSDLIKKTLLEVDLNCLSLNNNGEYEFNSYFCSLYKLQPIIASSITWFHFTKSLDLNSFKRLGILPSNKALPILKEQIYHFI
jgi:hypothetical protein